jgi:hypothetical protein
VNRTLLLARTQLLDARKKRPTPYVDTTLYTSWNAMFVSAYLEAAQVLDTAPALAENSAQAPINQQTPAYCRAFALRTLDRFLAESWDDRRGFSHRLGGERLEGGLDDQVFMAAALLDAFEATLDRRYFDAAERAAKLFLEKFGDPAGGGFFDRASDAAPMGGLDVRRKPLQDSPTPGGNPIAAIVLDRLHDYTRNAAYREASDATLAAFAGGAAEFGLFAATYGLASVLHARHPIQVVVTGKGADDAAMQLERAARMHYRFGKAVLRVAPGSSDVTSAEGFTPPSSLPASLQGTLPHLRAAEAQAYVCAGGACYPPVNDAGKLAELLLRVGAETGASAR